MVNKEIIFYVNINGVKAECVVIKTQPELTDDIFMRLFFQEIQTTFLYVFKKTDGGCLFVPRGALETLIFETMPAKEANHE